MKFIQMIKRSHSYLIGGTFVDCWSVESMVILSKTNTTLW